MECPTPLQEFPCIKKPLVAVATMLAVGVACAQTPDTLKKIKDSGAVTMGVPKPRVL